MKDRHDWFGSEIVPIRLVGLNYVIFKFLTNWSIRL